MTSTPTSGRSDVPALVQIEKLGERVARVLAARIIDAGGGTRRALRLPTEREISEEFGVSKTVAREVVAHLSSMRLVVVHHGRRMQMLPESDWNFLHPVMLELQDEDGKRRLLAELFDVRLLIEPETAARAARDATGEQLTRMVDHLDAMQRSIDAPDEYLEHDVAFHQVVIGASENRLLAHILDSVRHLMTTSRRVTMTVPDSRPQAVEGHREVYEAIRDGDPGRARSAMRDHLLWGAMRAGIIPAGAPRDVADKPAP